MDNQDKLEFDWDTKKARINERKHKVSFDEATTIFGDRHARTFHDPDHSDYEERFITIGLSFRRLLIVSLRLKMMDRFGLSALENPHARNRNCTRKNKMNKQISQSDNDDELRPNYTRADLGEGERGKFYDRYMKRTHIIKLDGDVARAFPNDRSVNEALRMLMRVAEQTSEELPPKRKSA